MHFGRFLKEFNLVGQSVLRRKEVGRNLVKIEVARNFLAAEGGLERKRICLKSLGPIDFNQSKGKLQKLFTEEEKKVLLPGEHLANTFVFVWNKEQETLVALRDCLKSGRLLSFKMMMHDIQNVHLPSGKNAS